MRAERERERTIVSNMIKIAALSRMILEGERERENDTERESNSPVPWMPTLFAGTIGCNDRDEGSSSIFRRPWDSIRSRIPVRVKVKL